MMIMDNLGLFIGNLDPFNWVSFGVKSIEGDGAGGDGSGDGSGDGAGDGSGDGGDKGGDGGSGGATTPSAFDALPDDLRNNPSLVKFKDSEGGYVPTLSKSYVELQKKIGAKGIIIPGEGASKEDIEAYKIATGRPAKLEDYGEFTLPEGTDKRLGLDQKTIDGFKNLAFESGLSKDVTDKILAFDIQRQDAALKELDILEKQEKDEAETTLRNELGNAYPERMTIAKKVVERFAGNDEDKKALYEAVGNNPRVARLLINVGSKISEDVLGEMGNASMTLTPAEASAKIKVIRNDAKHPHNDATSPLHQEALAEMTLLYKQAHPSKGGK